MGFMNPDLNTQFRHPSYEEVREGYTGHVEVVHILFDSNIIPYEWMCQFFFSFHDPTCKNRQGNDYGT